MTNYSKPSDINLVWGTSGIVSKPSDFKWAQGWVQEKPPFEQMNYIHRKHDSWTAYSNQKGIPEWDNSTIYYNNSYTQVAGSVYRSKTNNNINNNPSTDLSEANWRLIFDGNSRLTYESDFSTFGKSFSQTANMATARTLLGATSVGTNVFTATSTALARSSIGITGTGSNLVTASNISEAQTALGVSTFIKGLLDRPNGDSSLFYQGVSSTGIILLKQPNQDAMLSYLGVTNTARDFLKLTTVSNMQSYLGVKNAGQGVAGQVRMATSIETETSTSPNLAISPLTLRFGMVLSLGTNGGIGFPSWMGGFTVNWGVANIAGVSNGSSVSNPVSWSVPYTDGAVFQMFGTFGSGSNTQDSQIKCENLTTAGGSITHYSSNSTPRLIRWFSIGRRG